jgi:hypothetical protein
MIVIKSQKFPDSKVTGEEMQQFLQDLDGYSDKVLKRIGGFAFIIMQIERFTREEKKLLVGHIDYILRQRKAKS